MRALSTDFPSTSWSNPIWQGMPAPPYHKKNPPSGLSHGSWGSPQFQEASLTGRQEIKVLGSRTRIRKWWYIICLSEPRQVICWKLIAGIFVQQPHWLKVVSWSAWQVSLATGPGWGCCPLCNDSLIIDQEHPLQPWSKFAGGPKFPKVVWFITCPFALGPSQSRRIPPFLQGWLKICLNQQKRKP